MTISRSVLELIGATPMVRAQRLDTGRIVERRRRGLQPLLQEVAAILPQDVAEFAQDRVTLADLMLITHLSYLRQTPEGGEILARYPGLVAWIERMEARDSLQLEPVALDELVRRSVLMFLPRADARGVDLGAVGLDSPVQVQGSVALLEGLLNNLIDNALRYGRPPDGAPPRVTVELRREAHEVELSVSDNGPGMALTHREVLLRRWAQGEAGAKLGEGAGLGLAIVARYAALLGGRIELGTAAEGRGLRASLRLSVIGDAQ